MIGKLNNKWSTYLGCSVAQLTDNRRHAVPAKELAGSERPPWPALLRPIRLFTVSEGWILSVPPEVVEIAEASCLDLSYEDLTAEGDRISQEWFDSRHTHRQSPRPSGGVYLNLHRLMGNRQYRGWSHYVFSYCNVEEWTDSDDPHIVDLQDSLPDIKKQWDNWPGPMCSKRHQTHFEVADALGYALGGKLVAVGQIEADNSEYSWEYGIDTLVGYWSAPGCMDTCSSGCSMKPEVRFG
jgi:hypothetical protein